METLIMEMEAQPTTDRLLWRVLTLIKGSKLDYDLSVNVNKTSS